MITCIIVDDEPKSISVLKKMLNIYCPDVIIEGSAGNATEAVELIRQHAPRLLFLDIEMPKENGFDLLEKLMPVTFDVIFVTAFDSYAVKAFRYNALDYILKPIDIEALMEAVQKVRNSANITEMNMRLNNLIKEIKTNETSKIALRTQQGILFYLIADIVLCAAEGAYTRFEFVNSKSLLVTGNLKKYEESLPTQHFCRIHDGYLINIQHVVSYHPGKSGYVEMVNGRKVEVSLRRKNAFLSMLRI
ncbi:MAG TPA: LytTR family DNA-binding domain-containing protein [Chitinophaga sp.]|uniref:LytR/AlgR family response regulator transcription factor n=1 Tax=Chitinophaga sp. TaxID=1869181 RepID=UPI002B9078A4|nr:LytTR family DNA-binding domain-containing protein [Chitinophaga sp.]HVI43637.1 LytTR family DNA-binding domain-containing protein [Chitinophaga sp.]